MTYREVYQILILEAGLPPDYVMDKMELYEVDIILEHLAYKERNSWEQTRLLLYAMLQQCSKKQLKIEDILKFPWDEKKSSASDISAEDVERLMKKAEQFIKSKNDASRFSNKVITGE